MDLNDDFVPNNTTNYEREDEDHYFSVSCDYFEDFFEGDAFPMKKERVEQIRQRMGTISPIKISMERIVEAPPPSQMQHQSERVSSSSSYVPSDQGQVVNFVEKAPAKTKKLKNSNVIKKLGKVLMDHSEEFQGGSKNPGFHLMNKSLIKAAGDHDKRDKFNTYYLKMIIEGGGPSECKKNLRAISSILNKHIRNDVLFRSPQIRTDDQRLLYLNTLKCSSLRSMSKKLVTRLQIAVSKEDKCQL